MYLYKRKKNSQQHLEEIYEYQDIGTCADCGDDAYVELRKSENRYAFACHNECCNRHWPPTFSHARSDLPDWFVEYHL